MLVGIRYIQDTNPGAPPSDGYEWFKPSTGELFIRMSGVWNPMGNASAPYLGLVPVSGADMTGNLGGVTGWAPVASPDFGSSAKRDGIELATKGDLSSLRREMIQRFNTVFAEATSNLSTSSSVKNNVAFKSAIYTTGGQDYDFTIPFPQYDGGTGDTATRAEIIAHACWPARADYPTLNNMQFRVSLVNDTSMTWHARMIDLSNSNQYPIDIGYMVIAVR